MKQEKKDPMLLSALRYVAFLMTIGCLFTGYAADASGADPFSVILLPDTQKYTMQSPVDNIYSIQTSWVADNVETENIKFMIHLGDIVEHANTYSSEWDIADDAHTILEQHAPNPVPYSIMPGNHDMTGSGAPSYTRDPSLYYQYFGPNRFTGQSWYGGSMDIANCNNYSFFSAGDLDFMVLSLELMARDYTLSWANDVLDAYPNHRVIVTTHKYLKANGARDTDTVYGGFFGNNANQVFDKLISDHQNVFMVVCGHAHGEALHVGTNAVGNPVYEVLGDYQELANGGNGWLRNLKFDPDVNQITVSSYSPYLDQHNLWGEYTLDYDMGGSTPEPPLPMPANPLGHWTLDDGQSDPYATTAADASPNGNDGTLLNFGSPPSWQTGRLDGSLKFDGTNDRVDMGNPDELDITGSLSMSFWMYREGNSSSSYGNLVGKNFSGGSDDDAYYVASYNDGSKLLFRVKSSSEAVCDLTSASSISNSEWHHVAVVFDAGERMAIYIDGDFDIELLTAVPDDVQTEDTVFTLGNLATGSSMNTYCFNGRLDDVRVFEGVLTTTQIERLAAGLEPFVPGDANSDGSIDEQDAAILAENWGESDATWAMGNFDGDTVVGPRDAAILAANWHAPASAESGVSVPEPSVGLLLCGAVATLALRRRIGQSRSA